MITLQYTIIVKLFNRNTKKYFTLTNVFNTIIETTKDPKYKVKQANILDYVRDEYESYLSSNSLTENDISISSYKVYSEDTAINFYFEESDTKYMPYLMCDLYKPSSFLWGYETYEEGIIYGWDNNITINPNNVNHAGLIVEVFDTDNNTVIYTSTTTVNYYIEKVQDKNIPLNRRLRVYTSSKDFLYETDIYTITPQQYNSGPIIPIDSLYNKENKAIFNDVIEENLKVFRSGVGYGNDLLVSKNYEDYTDISYNLIIKLLGNYDKAYKVYDKVSFNYKSQCDYKQDYQVVDGKVSFEAEGFQYGSIALRMYKYDYESLRITYNLKAKLTYFTNEPNGGTIKTWRTVNIVIPQSFTHDLKDYIYYDGNTVKIKETLWYGVIDPNNNKAVKDIVLEYINGKYTIGNTIYHLYDYEISDVKVYSSNGELYHTGNNGPLDVTFQYINNIVNVNSPVKYYNKGLTIFEGETYITEELDNKYHDVLLNKNFNFPMYSRFNNKMLTNSNNLKISIYKKDAYIESTLNEVTKQCLCRSTKNFTVNKFYVSLDEKDTAYLFDMQKLLNLSTTFDSISQLFSMSPKYNFTIKVIGNKGPVQEYGTGKTLNSISDVAQIKVVGDKYCGRLCVEAKPVTKTRNITLYEPADEYVLGIVNGNTNAFKMTSKGKKNLSINSIPFMIPLDGYNIQYSIITKDIFPPAATINSTITPSTNQEEYAFNCVFSSNYMSDIYLNEAEEITTYTYSEKLLTQEPKNNKYVIDKPGNFAKPYTSFSIAVDTDNPEAAVKEFNKNIEFVNNKANVFTRVIAQKHPASDWNLKIRNGYYYLNQHEHFLYSKSEPNGPKVLVNGVPYFTLTNNKVQLSPVPQQFAPIIVETDEYGLLQYIVPTEDDNISIKQEYISKKNQREFELAYFNIDSNTVTIFVDDVKNNDYTLETRSIIFNNGIKENAKVKITYKILNSFSISNAPDLPNACVITIHTPTIVSKAKISYETNLTDNHIPIDLSINPVHNLQKSGFVYLTYEDTMPYKIDIYSISSIKANNKDKAMIYCTVKDQFGNPVDFINVSFTIQEGSGTLTTINGITDNNGVAIATYTTSVAGNSIINVSAGAVSNKIKIKSY